MKKFISCVISILFLSTSASYAQFEIKLSDELFLSKIRDNVYVVTHYFPWESNSLLIQASAKEVVLIDTPYDTAATSLMLNWISENMGDQKITAINTGFHVDNLGGNERLLKQGIPVYGSDLTVKLLDERSLITQQQMLMWFKPGQEKYRQVYENMTFCKPDKVFNIFEGLNMKIGNFTFEVYYPGESHSPDNAVVYIKELELLFGGCMIKSLSANNLGFTGDANLAEWPVSIRKVQVKYDKAKVVIPHHGLWGDLKLIQHTLDLLTKNN